MSDVGPYGVTQHAVAEQVTANALVGERAGNVTDNQSDARFAPARDSTAPYIPPPEKRYPDDRRDDEGHLFCRGKDNTCHNWRLRGDIHCRWHKQ